MEICDHFIIYSDHSDLVSSVPKTSKTTNHTKSKPEQIPDNKKTQPNITDQILHLQRTIGNQAVNRLIQNVTISPKLSVSKPSDSAEIEADNTADRIMKMADYSIQRQIPEEEELLQGKLMRQADPEDEELQEKSDNPETNFDVESQINSAKGGGSHLDGSTKGFMESRFGNDFSDVKVHTDSQASNLNKAINAKAFATGNDIFFREGQYNPGSNEGKHLLAHELTHTVQQKSSRQIHRMMTQEQFIEKSGGSKRRNNVLKVDVALERIEKADSKSQALNTLIGICKDYLESSDKKSKSRIEGVKSLLNEAIDELREWYHRPLPPRPEFVYRMEKDKPDEVAEKGFKSTGQDQSDVTIIEHVTNALKTKREPKQGRNKNYSKGSGEINSNAKSHTHWISTAGSLDFVKDPTLLQGIMEKYVYKISTKIDPDSFVDASLEFNRKHEPNPYEKQFEFAQKGGIPPEWVTHYVEAKVFVPIISNDEGASFDKITWQKMSKTE